MVILFNTIVLYASVWVVHWLELLFRFVLFCQAVSFVSFLLLYSIFTGWKSLLPHFISSNLFSRHSGEGEFGDKSSGSWGVLGQPKARRRSTGLLRRDVIILVTCYRRACSPVYLQLLLPLGAHFNAWGWLLCNEFRNTGRQCKKRSETREARSHCLITNRSARQKEQGTRHHTGQWKCKEKQKIKQNK